MIERMILFGASGDLTSRCRRVPHDPATEAVGGHHPIGVNCGLGVKRHAAWSLKATQSHCG